MGHFSSEGTHVRDHPAPDTDWISEHDVEQRCAEFFSATPGIALAAYSPQNVDRMITLYRAARAAGRKFVVDLYAASIAEAADEPAAPRWDSEDVLVYVPQSQRVKVKRSGEFHRVDALRARRIFPDQLAARAAELVLTFRRSMVPDFERAGCLSGASAIWSLWAGYLQDPEGQRLGRWFEDNEIPLMVAHSSGHASIADLQRLARAIDAARVVPIHTSAPRRYSDVFEGVELHADGEWWAV